MTKGSGEMKSAAVNAPFKEDSNRRGDGLSADSNGPVEKRLSARLLQEWMTGRQHLNQTQFLDFYFCQLL